MNARFSGFTLLELLVSLIVLTTLITMAYPSFSGLIQKSKHQSEVRELYQALQFARYTAISHNALVTICPIHENKCTNNWNEPLGVFLDPLNQKEITNEEFLKKMLPAPKHNKLLAFPTTKNFFQFRGTGETKGTPGRIEVTLNAREDIERSRSKIIVSWSGRPRIVHE
ncbi:MULTISPECIES: GspH/FimT family pseudopilin [Marinobacter]|uniref:GspH/FimT family pseudopilin n=1 Tax=Marinobacter TaxID=2742 RepID=UPI003B42B2C9|nr:GspH/FimT family pseudopilin [Marinobacter alkaliphilus]